MEPVEFDFEFAGRVVEWRGPAPYFFVAVGQEETDTIKQAARGLEYWGQVPVTARINDAVFFTALFPKDGRYLLPLRAAVRQSARVGLGMTVHVAMNVGRP